MQHRTSQGLRYITRYHMTYQSSPCPKADMVLCPSESSESLFIIAYFFEATESMTPTVDPTSGAMEAISELSICPEGPHEARPSSDDPHDEVIPVVSDENLPDEPCEPSPSTASPLESLPTELLDAIADELDLQSFGRLTLVSKRFKLVLDAKMLSSSARKHLPEIFHQIGRFNLGRFIVFASIDKALRQAYCEVCTDFARFIYLPRCVRVCRYCLQQLRQYKMLTPSQIKLEFKVRPRHLQDLSHAEVLVPGAHGMTLQQRWDYVCAREKGMKLYPDRLGWCVGAERKLRTAAAAERVATPAVLRQIRADNPGYAMYEAPLTAMPFSVSVHASVLRPDGQMDAGHTCEGCQPYGCMPLNNLRHFDALTYAKHLAECGRVVNGQHVFPI